MSNSEEFVIEDLLPLAIDYCSSQSFVEPIERFTSRNAATFSHASESKNDEVVEMSHEYHTLFLEYQSLVEDLLEKLAEKHGFTIKALFRCFRDAVDGKFTALFEEHEHKWFVDKVLSWMDFNEFIRMMRRAGSGYSKK